MSWSNYLHEQALELSDLSKKVRYIRVINKNIIRLYDNFRQYCQIFRLSLLQIMSAEAYTDFKVDEMEE